MTPTPVAMRTTLPPEEADFTGGGPSEDCMTFGDELLDERAFSKLRWRCRRGLLENDLLIEKFFQRFASTLTVSQAKGLNDLMELSDNDLLDLLLQRKEPGQLPEADSKASASTFEALMVLNLLRPVPPRTVSAFPSLVYHV